jgi:hypothetical protein
MAVLTIGRLSEEILRMLDGGQIQSASAVSANEVKIAIGQVANSLLKVDYLTVNAKLGETIANGTVLGLYEGITPTSYQTGKSKATLPIKPLKLPRNMGIFSVFLSHEPDNEFIPLQMGQRNLLASQPLINDLLGQVGYENFGLELVFTKDLPLLYPDKTLSMRLAIMDISEYGDYDVLPLLPEHEFQIKQEVVKMFSGIGIADKLVDSTTKQNQNIPLNQQKES